MNKYNLKPGMGGPDFSKFNVQYFLAARELVRETPAAAATLLCGSSEVLQLLDSLAPEQFASLISISIPMVVPRSHPVWWNRLSKALSDDNHAEIEALCDQAGYFFIEHSGSDHE